MAKSTTKRRVVKSKQNKPYPEFPLTAHPSGRWCKKRKGKQFYFGPVADWEGALARYEQEWPYILQHGEYPPGETVDSADEGCTMQTLCNSFLIAKLDKLESGDLSPQSFADYRHTTDRLIDQFGCDRRVDQLRPSDFQQFRRKLADKLGPVTLKNQINRFRIVLKYASDQKLIAAPVEFGQSFDKPSAKMIRKSRREGGKKFFEADEVRRILDALDGKAIDVDDDVDPLELKPDPVLRAMVLLGLNAGFGNTDVATLPRSAVDLDRGWIEFPRPKTEIERRCPLWPETVEALRDALVRRPQPKSRENAGLCFITIQGNPWVRVTEGKVSDRFVKMDSITGRFGRLLKKLKINGRRRLGFYCLRHNFETIGGESRDPVAVSAIMGHADHSMSAVYREGVSDQRLTTVTDTIQKWIWPDDLTRPKS